MINDALVATAKEQWERWGGPSEALDSSLHGFPSNHMEDTEPFWKYVGEYWESIGVHLTGKDKPAWSAAFICYCFKTAGAHKAFPYRDNHSLYAAEIAAGLYKGLSLEDPAKVTLSPGDLIWASRTGQGCRTPPKTFIDAEKEAALIHAKKADGFCSHCDIVIATAPGHVDVIGGNVHNAVTRTTYRLDAQGHLSDGRRAFIGIIKVAI